MFEVSESTGRLARSSATANQPRSASQKASLNASLIWPALACQWPAPAASPAAAASRALAR